jgi:hypothetical protein
MIALLIAPGTSQGQVVGMTQIRPFITGYIPVVGSDGSVGGISIDADGVLATARPEAVRRLKEARERLFTAVPDALTDAVPLRKISLKRLEAAVADAAKDKRPLADEFRLLGGLQRVRYVFVYPAQNDIVLVGPAEGWRVDDAGTTVGLTTGRPVMILDDLLVALRSARAARAAPISCSIEPTPEGRRAFEAYMRRQRQFTPTAVGGIQRALGAQQIIVTGVPAESHLARVLVASDYRMKRIAMLLDPSPVRELPSYLDLVRSARDVDRSAMPRWWLACDYEPLLCSEDGLAWELRGRGVKAMTEDDLIAADGTTTRTGTANPVAQKWADRMNAHYEELAAKDAVFGQLRNVMDLCVVAALIDRYDLKGRAGCSLPHLTRADSPVGTAQFRAAKSVATQCSVVKRGRNWIITASGGVEIDGWQIVERRQPADEVTKLRHEATPRDDAVWCWN